MVAVTKVVDPSWRRQKNSDLNAIGAMKKQMAISTTAGLLAISLTTYAQTSVFATVSYVSAGVYLSPA